ncbi:hypothetical protein LPJ56_004086 [Coemansia sp. RSA 2599]|nr:hypothetical protein LPJ75_003878 [Coemansia sp. RSA 2598]KAJ1817356.1 hypothetical protein LPJ56_004086 [Coemansia sp. RSA 2599]
MALFPESKHAMLMSFIQRNASVVGQPDLLEAMYRRVLDIRLLGSRSVCAAGSSSRQSNGGGAGGAGVVDAARLLRNELDSASGPLSDSMASSMRKELTALSLAISRFLQDI